MIITPFKPHQVPALAHLRKYGSSALAMFLGSGKSLIALAWADELDCRKVLICSDKTNATDTWPEQIYRHTDWDCDIRSLGSGRATTVNYDYLWRHYFEWRAVQWDMVILDESSEFKDQRTHKHDGLARAIRYIPRRCMLNGTLMTERIEDLFGQFKILDGGNALGRTITEFRRRYMQPSPDGYGWVPVRSALTMIKRDLGDLVYWHEDRGDIRMPKQEYTLIKCEMTDEQRRIDDELKTMFASSLDGREIEVDTAAAVFIKRLQICGGVFRETSQEEIEDKSMVVERPLGSGLEKQSPRRVSWVDVPTPKLQVVEALVKDHPDSKIVVWHSYIPETGLLRKTLTENELGGVVQIYEGPEGLSRFARARVGVLLLRTSFCKGINQLADADIAIFYSNPLSYARRAQAEGRSCRISSAIKATHYYDIVCGDGADSIVYKQLKNKRSFSLTLKNLRGTLGKTEGR